VLTEFGLKIAPSTYYAALTRRPSRRAVRDEELKTMIVKIYEENYSVYGAKKVWRQLRRDGVQVGRCRVERLMRDLQLVGVLRGKIVRTTVPDPAAERAADLVKRQFTAGAPNRLWVADFTYVATWAGTVYTAFAIDAFSRKIVGWKTSMSKETDLVLATIRHHRQGPTRPAHCISPARESTSWCIIPMRVAVHVVPVRSAPARRRNRCVDRHRRGRVRQRPGRINNRPVQDRVDKAAGPVAYSE
jgi:hypothetical protein